MTLIRDINNILEYGMKTTSYKYATLLGIFDYIIQHPTEPPTNNFHFIPIVYLAKQFFFYYYPFSFYDYYQASLPPDSKLVIIKYIEKFKNEIKSTLDIGNEYITRIKTSKEDGIFWINRLYELPQNLPIQLIEAIWKIRKRILYQPLQYLHNVNGELIRFFGLINENTKFNSSYKKHRKNAMTQKCPELMNWLTLLEYEHSYLTIDDITFNELSKYRFWAREVILKAWYKYIIEGEKRRDSEQTDFSHIYRMLGYIYSEEIARDPNLISTYRDLYQDLRLNKCIYSGEILEKNQNFHLDHLLPWSYYPINRFWNLFPSLSEINLKKSNLLPKLDSVLEFRIVKHLEICVKNRMNYGSNLINHDLQYFYKILQNDKDIIEKPREDELIIKELFTFIKSEWFDLRKLIPGQLFKYQ
jgi:hypothetical protein